MHKNRFRFVTTVILTIFLLGAVTTTNADAGITIMPLGYSITYGYPGTNAGYRGPLCGLLTSAGVDFQFVGDSTLNPGLLPTDQMQHSGHSSYTTYDITNNLDGLDTTRFDQFGGIDRDPHGGYWITGGHETGRDAVSPDVILLMAGVNDLYFGQDVNAQSNLRALLTTLTTLTPNANILIADIPPSPVYGTRIDDWNMAVNNEVEYFQTLEKNVILVDLNTNFPGNGLSGDNVHPSDVGYNWIAEQWNNAVSELTMHERIAGDANGDKKVDGSDVTILAGNWQAGVNAPIAVAPEPGTMLLLLSAFGSLLIWKRIK